MYLQVGEHFEEAFKELSIDEFAVSFSWDELEKTIDGSLFDDCVANDVRSKQLQSHVPETNTPLKIYPNWRETV